MSNEFIFPESHDEMTMQSNVVIVCPVCKQERKQIWETELLADLSEMGMKMIGRKQGVYYLSGSCNTVCYSKKRVAFTGHRPDKLGNAYDLNHINSIKIRERLIQLFFQHRLIHFISGGAQGFDQNAFWAIQEYKKIREENEAKFDYVCQILNVLAIPFKEQDCKWKENDRIMYNKMIQKADHVIYVDRYKGYQSPGEIDRYHVSKMHRRNEFMVDHCDLLIALWDGSSGGTSACIEYARKKEKEILIIDPKTILK